MDYIFDTHCHPHLNTEKNLDEVINNFFDNGGNFMTVIGTDMSKNKAVIDISKKYDGIYATIGIHPCDVYELDLEKTMNQLEKLYLYNKDKIVGIGECGLDYYWLYKDEKINNLEDKFKIKIIESKKKLQIIFFKAQILLAKKYNLPVIIHNRDSKDDVLAILKDIGYKKFIFHCYSENLDYANKLINFAPECKISFSGIITFKNSKEIQETAKYIDIKHILAETDSPYLTPTPYRGKEENEPLYTKYIIEKINELKGKECSNEIFNNSLEVFNLKK